MRTRSSSHALSRNRGTAAEMVSRIVRLTACRHRIAVRKTENSLMNASHAWRPSVGVFARVEGSFASGAKCV